MYHIRYLDGGEGETVSQDCIRAVSTGDEGKEGEGVEGEAYVGEITGEYIVAGTGGGEENGDACCDKRYPSQFGSYVNTSDESGNSTPVPSTVFSVKGYDVSDGAPYKHRLGIGEDDTPLLERYEVLAEIANLYVKIARSGSGSDPIGNGSCVDSPIPEVDVDSAAEEAVSVVRDTDHSKDQAGKETATTVANAAVKQAVLCFNEAAECAMVAGKTALAMKYLEEVSALEV